MATNTRAILQILVLLCSIHRSNGSLQHHRCPFLAAPPSHFRAHLRPPLFLSSVQSQAWNQSAPLNLKKVNMRIGRLDHLTRGTAKCTAPAVLIFTHNLTFPERKQCRRRGDNNRNKREAREGIKQEEKKQPDVCYYTHSHVRNVGYKFMWPAATGKKAPSIMTCVNIRGCSISTGRVNIKGKQSCHRGLLKMTQTRWVYLKAWIKQVPLLARRWCMRHHQLHNSLYLLRHPLFLFSGSTSIILLAPSGRRPRWHCIRQFIQLFTAQSAATEGCKQLFSHAEWKDVKTAFDVRNLLGSPWTSIMVWLEAELCN